MTSSIGSNQPTPQDPTSISHGPLTSPGGIEAHKVITDANTPSVKERAKAIEQAVNQGPIGHIKTSEGNQQVTVLTPIVPSYKISREPAEAFQKYGQAVSDLVDSLKTVDAEENIPSTKPPETSALDAFNAVADAHPLPTSTVDTPASQGPLSAKTAPTASTWKRSDPPSSNAGVTIEGTDSGPKTISASNINNNSVIDVADVSDKVKDQLKTAEKVAKVVGACLLVAGGLAIFTVSLLAGFTLGPVALIGTIAGGALFSAGVALAMHAAVGDKDEKDKADAEALSGDTPVGPNMPSFGPAAGSPRIDRGDNDAVRREDDEIEDSMDLDYLFGNRPLAESREGSVADEAQTAELPPPPPQPPVGLEDPKPTIKQRDSLMEGLGKSEMFKKAKEANNPEAVNPSETQESQEPPSTSGS